MAAAPVPVSGPRVQASAALALLALARRRPRVTTLLAACLGLGLRALARWWAWHRWRLLRRCLQLSSPLEASAVKLAQPRSGWHCRWSWSWARLPDAWRGFCPCCKRPIDARLVERWAAKPPKPHAVDRFAFVINLWGASPEYVLGALVLGYSIKRMGSPHARVCLHTGDVPAPYLRLIAQIWDCRQIEHIDVASQSLSVKDQCERFEKVFTKLRGMELTEFAKILVMDIDMLVRSNIDELFQLTPPAAMKRGMNDSRKPAKHGDPIDARCFFLGKDDSKWSWGVGTGINAGTMLWQPDKEVLQEMLDELTEPNHPEHMRGNGPEQDYLSRFWADAPWSHVGVEYNFQLHQMFFSIHPDRCARTERRMFLSDPDKVKIVHYSGVPAAKPWHRILDEAWDGWWPSRERDAEYAERYAEEFMGYWLWIKKDKASFESSTRNPKNWDVKGMYIGSDGQIWRVPWELGRDEPELVEVPEAATSGAMSFLSLVLKEWFDTLQELERELGLDLQQAMSAASAAVKEGARPPAAPPPPRFSAGAGSTGGTDGEDHPPPVVHAGGYEVAAGGPVQQFLWDRPSGGWWTEHAGGAAGEASKAAVMCGAVGGVRRFVSFLEGGEEVFDEQGDDLAGLFVKVAGTHSARSFRLPSASGSEGPVDLAEALGPIHFWTKGVPQDCTILLALVGVAPDALGPTLEVLAGIGAPQVPPPAECRALAAVGRCRGGAGGGSVASGGWWNGGPKGKQEAASDNTFASHASVDVAYAAMPQPCR